MRPKPPARWLARRSALAMSVVLAVATLTFALIHLAPGDPVFLLAGEGGSPSYYADMRAKYGLDRPLLTQFGRYVQAVGTGDFGYSFMYQAPVTRVIREHAPASLLLGGTALAIATAGGFGLGLLCAVRPGGGVDAAIRALASVAYSAPVFSTGQILILIWGVKLGVLPVAGITTAREDLAGLAQVADVARHLILPAIALSLPFMAVVIRVTRAGILDALTEPFVLAARARGLGAWRVVVRHAAAGTLVTIVALVGEHAGQIAGGAALTEALFGWPGVGWLVLHASLHRDYPLVIAAFIVISAGVVVANIVTDVACAAIDPRIRLS